MLGMTATGRHITSTILPKCALAFMWSNACAASAKGKVRSIGRLSLPASIADLWPAIEAGKISLPIDRTFPLAEAAQALEHMKANAHFGKIVLVM